MVAVCVGRLAEIPSGRMAEVNVDGRTYVICNVAGDIYALNGNCPHRGAPLAHGALHDYTVVCPWHGWEFDCRTGEGDCGNVGVIPVTIEEDRIYLHAGTT